MAALRRARRAAAFLALALGTLGGCGGDDIPPVPEELRRLEQQEAGCLACHNGRNRPFLDLDKTATPTGHPPTAIWRGIDSVERAKLTSGR